MKLRWAIVFAAFALVSNGSIMHAQTLTTLASFNGTNGSDPTAGLVMDSAGNLYGTTYNGGAYSSGTVFEIDAATHSLTTIFSFNGDNGASPQAGITLGAGGVLYGTTNIGGANGYGTIFTLDPSSRSLTTVYSFDDGINGAFPSAALTLDGGGNLYGTTPYGGAYGWGTLFTIDSSSHSLTTLLSFTAGFTDPKRPVTPMIVGSNGTLIGTTAGGGANNNGTVFMFSTSSNSLAALASFGGTSGGPPSEVIADASANLFGTTAFGGVGNHGTIYEFSPSTGALTTLATFNGSNGGEPRAGLIADANGNLYGTTFEGGENNAGTIFELDATTHIITTLASFNGGPESGPFGGLVADGNGNFYGTTSGGGDYGHGTVFELSLPEPGSLSMLAAATLVALFRPRQRQTKEYQGRR